MRTKESGLIRIRVRTRPKPRTNVYTAEQVCTALGIGERKLRQLVADGRLPRLRYTDRLRFWGQSAIDFCTSESRTGDAP